MLCWSQVYSKGTQLFVIFVAVQSLNRVRLFATPGTAARQASLSITSSQSSLKLMSTESVMPSSHLILCRPLLLPPSIFPSIRAFSNELALRIRCQSTGASASASVLPMRIQGGFLFGLTGLISLLSKEIKYIYTLCIYYIIVFFYFHYSLLQDIEYSSLYYE